MTEVCTLAGVLLRGLQLEQEPSAWHAPEERRYWLPHLEVERAVLDLCRERGGVCVKEGGGEKGGGEGAGERDERDRERRGEMRWATAAYYAVTIDYTWRTAAGCHYRVHTVEYTL
jgi:hypothetical protein